MTSNETERPIGEQTSTVVENTAGHDAAEIAVTAVAHPSEDREQASVPETGVPETSAAATSADKPDSLPGEFLAARRNELRLTLEQVSQRLKLAPRQITAIETNDFASLPGMASVRGFIRSYAKLLELDPVPLLEMIPGGSNPAADPVVLRRPLPSRGFPGRRYGPPSGHRRGALRLSGIALLVLVFVGALAYAAYRHNLVDAGSINVSGVGKLFSSLSGKDAAKNQASSQPARLPVAPATAIAEQKPIDPSHLLELRLREDAWVEISSLNGNKLVSRLMKAGATEQFDMNEPVILVVGNANGVDASLRGQPLNLRAVARDNVSKLSLK